MIDRGRIGLVALAAALCPTFALRTWQWDDWWHLATGRLIAETHALPTTDPFSFTANGQAWHGVSWGADLAFYGAYALFGGFAGLGVLKAAAAFALMLLACFAMRSVGASRAHTAAALVGGWAFLQARNTTARPEILAALLLAGCMIVALRGWREDASRWALAPIAPLALVWIFVHASALLALVVLALTCGAMLVARRPRAAIVRALVVLAIAIEVFVATKPGQDVLWLASRHSASRSPLAFAITREWQHPDYTSGATIATLAFFVGALIAALADGARRRERILPAAFALLGIVLFVQADRHVATAALLNLPVWALALGDSVESVRTRGMLAAARLLPFAFALTAAGLQIVTSPDRHRFDIGLGVREDPLPGDTLGTLRKLPNGRVLNEFHFGGYLIWNRVPVFWDGRNVSLYTEAQLRDVFLRARADDRGLESVADRYEIAYGLASFQGDFGYTMMQSTEWLPVRYGRSSILFVRKRHAQRARDAGLPAHQELRFIPDDRFLVAWYAPVVREPARLEALVREYATAWSLSPGAPALADLPVFFDSVRPDVAKRLRAAQLPIQTP